MPDAHFPTAFASGGQPATQHKRNNGLLLPFLPFFSSTRNDPRSQPPNLLCVCVFLERSPAFFCFLMGVWNVTGVPGWSYRSDKIRNKNKRKECTATRGGVVGMHVPNDVCPPPVLYSNPGCRRKATLRNEIANAFISNPLSPPFLFELQPHQRVRIR